MPTDLDSTKKHTYIPLIPAVSTEVKDLLKREAALEEGHGFEHGCQVMYILVTPSARREG